MLLSSSSALAQYRLQAETQPELRIKSDSGTIVVAYTDKQITPREANVYHWTRQRQVYQTHGNYSGQLLHGVFERYYPDGQLAAKGHFEKGLKTGLWQHWNEDGSLRMNHRYKKGQLQGWQQRFAGDSLETYRYEKGVRHGKGTIAVNGTVVSTERYKRGQPVNATEKENRIKEHSADSTRIRTRRKDKKKADPVTIQESSTPGKQKRKTERQKDPAANPDEKKGWLKGLFKRSPKPENSTPSNSNKKDG